MSESAFSHEELLRDAKFKRLLDNEARRDALLAAARRLDPA